MWILHRGRHCRCRRIASISMTMSCLIILLTLLGKINGAHSQEVKWKLEDYSPVNHAQNISSAPLLLLRTNISAESPKDEEAVQTNSNMTLQEKDKEIYQLQEELEEAVKLMIEKFGVVKILHTELNRKADLLKIDISEREDELLELKDRYFTNQEGNSQLQLEVNSGIQKAFHELIQFGVDVHAKTNYSPNFITLAGGSEVDGNAILSQTENLIQQGINASSTVPHNCEDIQKSFNNASGIYTIFPFESTKDFSVQVYCDLETDGGGWTVFQRRRPPIIGIVEFERTWREYADGFSGYSRIDSHWLGLNIIAELTKAGDSALRIDMTDWDDTARFAEYSSFQVANETGKFKLSISDYAGDAGDSLAYHNEMYFSTKDRDNDADSDPENCAMKWRGAWWYNNCHMSNLNGLYLENGRNTDGKHIAWSHWHGGSYSLKTTEMKLRSRNFKGQGKCNQG